MKLHSERSDEMPLSSIKHQSLRANIEIPAMDDPNHILITQDERRAGEAHFRSIYANATLGMYASHPRTRTNADKARGSCQLSSIISAPCYNQR